LRISDTRQLLTIFSFITLIIAEVGDSSFHPLAEKLVWKVVGFNAAIVAASFPSPCGEVGLESWLGTLFFEDVQVSIPLRGSWFGKSSLLESLLGKGFRYPF
jgi:hypothetical protein